MTMHKGSHLYIPVRKETKDELLRIMGSTGAATYDDAIISIIDSDVPPCADDEVFGNEQEEDEGRY